MWLSAELFAINILSSLFGFFLQPDYRSETVLHLNVNVMEKNIVAKSFEFSYSAIQAANSMANDQFPDKFLFGVASSAYQIEGAYNTFGKGISVWDYWTHNNDLVQIADNANGDIACNSFYKYEDDINLVRNLNANMYRISLSWTRILPNGMANHVNPEGIQYYNKLINTIVLSGITPIVTIHHFDIPHKLQLLGGWTNPNMVQYFENYTRIAFTYFGDRVKYWITINDPWELCNIQFGNSIRPLYNDSEIGNYLCGHHVLLAHAKAYNMYRSEFQWLQKGKVGISLSTRWFEPEDYTSPEDAEAVERSFQFSNYWFLNPLAGEAGNYPEIMRSEIEAKSILQRFKSSKLPTFSREEVELVKNSLDFLGVSFYTTYSVHSYEANHESHGIAMDVSLENDMSSKWIPYGRPYSPYGIENTAENFGKLLRRISDDYVLPQIFITENGYADFGETDDFDRALYHYDHIKELFKTMKSGMDVRGYAAWSLMDSFEWEDGYRKRFGLYSVNFDDTNRPRKEKLSAKIIRKIYRSKSVPEAMPINN